MIKKTLTLGTMALFALGCNKKEAPEPVAPVIKTEISVPAPKPVIVKKDWDLYTVKTGDNLTSISRDYGWPHITPAEYFTKVQTKNNLVVNDQTDTRVVKQNFFIYDRNDVWHPENLKPFKGDGLVDKIYPGQQLYIPLPNK